LRSLPIMMAYIRGTTTETGLVVRARTMRKTWSAPQNLVQLIW